MTATMMTAEATPVATARKFSEQFTPAEIDFGLLSPKDHSASLFRLARASFQFLHGRVPGSKSAGEITSARIKNVHTSSRNQTGGNAFFGARAGFHKSTGTMVGCYCVGLNLLTIANSSIHAGVSDILVDNEAGGESGLVELILNDLETRAATWAAEAKCNRTLGVLVTKDAVRSVLSARGFTLAAAEVATIDFGSAALYTKTYVAPKKR